MRNVQISSEISNALFGRRDKSPGKMVSWQRSVLLHRHIRAPMCFLAWERSPVGGLLSNGVRKEAFLRNQSARKFDTQREVRDVGLEVESCLP